MNRIVTEGISAAQAIDEAIAHASRNGKVAELVDDQQPRFGELRELDLEPSLAEILAE